MVRHKTLRQLLTLVEENISSPKEIRERLNVSLSTAYDYANTLKKLEKIYRNRFIGDLDEKIKEIKTKVRDLEVLALELKSEEMDKMIRRILVGLEKIAEERKKRGL